jgi:hypothetical protein
MPGGLEFQQTSNGNAELSGTPINGTGGVYNLFLSARNVAGKSVQNLSIIVDQKPQFDQASHKNIVDTIGLGDFTPIRTTGFPPATITESGQLPSGFIFRSLPNGKAAISGRPALDAYGLYSISLTAQSVAGSVSIGISIVIVGLPFTTLIR